MTIQEPIQINTHTQVSLANKPHPLTQRMDNLDRHRSVHAIVFAVRGRDMHPSHCNCMHAGMDFSREEKDTTKACLGRQSRAWVPPFVKGRRQRAWLLVREMQRNIGFRNADQVYTSKQQRSAHCDTNDLTGRFE